MSRIKYTSFCESIHDHFKNGLVRVEFEIDSMDFKRYGKVVYGYLLPIDPNDKEIYGEVDEWNQENERFEMVPNKLKILKLTTEEVPAKFGNKDTIEFEVSNKGFYPHDMVEIRYVQENEY